MSAQDNGTRIDNGKVNAAFHASPVVLVCMGEGETRNSGNERGEASGVATVSDASSTTNRKATYTVSHSSRSLRRHCIASLLVLSFVGVERDLHGLIESSRTH